MLRAFSLKPPPHRIRDKQMGCNYCGRRAVGNVSGLMIFSFLRPPKDDGDDGDDDNDDSDSYV